MKTLCFILALCFLVGRADAYVAHARGHQVHREHGHHHHHGHHEDDYALKFSVHQKNYSLTIVFEMYSHGHPFGTVEKSASRYLKKPFCDIYDIYDEKGHWCASGYSRYVTTGFFRPWGAEFDVYDKHGGLIGVIDGQLVTTEAAKYSIYNARGDRVGIAYMDIGNGGFSIVHPERESDILVHLIRNFVKNEIDHWDVVIYDAEAIDPAIIKVFAAFALDYQAYFKADH